jgi:chromate transporter
MSPSQLFLYVLRAALLSTGGLGNVSSLHNSLVPRGIATDAQFGEALMVAQLAPGPNGLWVVSLGYIMLGPWGALACLAGILIPPFLIIGVERLYNKIQHHPATEGLVRGLNLAVVGVFAPVLLRLMNGPGVTVFTVSVALVAFGLGWIKRLPVLAIIGACGLVGAVATH